MSWRFDLAAAVTNIITFQTNRAFHFTAQDQTTHITGPLISSANMAANALNQVYRYAIPTAVAFSLASASIYDVKGGTRAVIFDRLSGVKETVVNEGTHFLVPWLQRAIMYDVRTKPRNISTTTGSKDLQMVSLTLRVLHRPDVAMLPKIYQVSLPRCSHCGEPTS